MEIIVKQTSLFTKLGKKVILEEENYRFCDDIWSIIKEFAGIYNFAINWKIKFTCHPYRIRPYLKFECPKNKNKELPETHYKKLPEDTLRRLLWKKVNKGEFKIQRHYSFYKQMNNKKEFLEHLEDSFGIFRLSNDFQVGDEVTFARCDYAWDQHSRAGKIIWIAEDRTSYKIIEYTSVELGYTMYNYDRKYEYGWDKTKTKNSTIKSDKGLKKGLHNFTYTSYYN